MTSVKPVEGVGVAVPPVLVPLPDTMPLGMVLKSGRTLTVITDQPAAQVYSGNWLEGCPVGKGGAVYHDYAAVAIECQGCPDAPNHPNFPSQRLNPGETYRRRIRFAFSAE